MLVLLLVLLLLF